MPRRNSSRFVTVNKQQFEEWLDQMPALTWVEVELDGVFEAVYDIATGDSVAQAEVVVRVYSTVDKRTGRTRDRGTDAIRIVYWDNRNEMPIGAGRKLLRTESARSTIGQRLQQRIAEFFATIGDVRSIDFAYVGYVLQQHIVNTTASRGREFAQSLVDQLEHRGNLTSKQVAYVLGDETPNGYATMEKKLENRGLDPRGSYERLRTVAAEAVIEGEAAEAAEVQSTGNNAGAGEVEPGRQLFDPDEAPNIMPRRTVTGRSTSNDPNMQTVHEVPRRSRTRERVDNTLTNMVDQVLARQQQRMGGEELLNVEVEEESDRMVSDLDKFVERFDGPPVVEAGEEVELVDTEYLEERFGVEYPFDYLNPVQSQVYREALDHNGNVVIGANTSSGKTVCAEMIAMKALDEGKKIVYLSPLKSLTQEKYSDWKELWPDKNITILTGDYVLSDARKRELAEADIIVMTSEMCDSRTRRMRREGNMWLYDVGVMVVDEAHILTTDRGHAVESGVMRFTHLNPHCRVVLLSATMPNVRQLAVWLTNMNGLESKVIQSSWRPVELELNYPQYQEARFSGSGRFDYHGTQQNKVALAVDIIRSRGKEDQKFLVFVHDKATGRKMVRALASADVLAHFHNADLDLEERLGIEKKFASRRRGSLRVIVSTSTLAWGRNLPARNVIIVGAHRGIQEVDPLDLIQMGGRAGRYGIDTKGTVYLLTPEGQLSRYETFMTVPRDITSVLAKKETLAFHMLAEVQNRVVVDKRTFLEWFSRSFASLGSTLDEELVTEVFDDMKQLEMLQHRQTLGTYYCTNLGNISAWLYYSPYDIAAWHRNFTAYFAHQETSEDEPLLLAWAFAHIPSFDLTYCPKELEDDYRQVQHALAQDSFHLNLGNTAAVVGALSSVVGEETRSGSAAAAKRSIQYDLNRMLSAIRLIDKKVAMWGADWKVMQARMKYGIGEELAPLVQIPGVGGVRAKKLYEHGITSVAKVASPTGKRKMLRIFKPAIVNKIHAAAKKVVKRRRR